MNENKFTGMGKIYSQFRPAYPQNFIDCLYNEVGFSEESVVADIGSGTGKLTKQLLEKESRVYAVEPNDDMRKIAEENLSSFSNFASVNGTAENTMLPDSSVDFITVAQAFHWFDRQKFKAECRRILKDNGTVVLVWNSRDERSPLILKIDEISRKYCPNFKGFSGGMRGGNAEEFDGFFAHRCEMKMFDNPLSFDERGFIGRCLSSSYSLKENDENYSDYLNELKNIFNKYSENGTLIMPNKTETFIGKV